MDKKSLTERDICTKFIAPAIQLAGWDIQKQVREEVSFTKGRIIVRGKLHSRGESRRADFILYHQANLPIAVIEAKDNKHDIGSGMQQALGYAESLDVPFVFSSNGDGFLFHDRTGTGTQVETELSLDQFPSPDELWQRYCQWKGLNGDARKKVESPYYDDGSGRMPRYYQTNAINRTVEAVAKGQSRILLVMATGTGKTYTAFQIIWRLWKSKQKKRILFLADRNILVDQTKNNDFKPFGQAMTKIAKRQIDTSYEIYLSLYQAVTGTEEEMNVYKQFSRDFFDLIVIDECHRGSAAEDSAWREILEYFSSATHVGLTATPKETKEVSSITYFGEPVYSYTLKQGIEDGFLAPYKVVRIDFDKDLQGWRPPKGMLDKNGELIEDRIYNLKDMDRTLVIEARTQLVAQKVTEFLKATDPFQKTIIFCDDINHAERMRQALVNLNRETADLFLVLIMQLLKDGGRAAVVLPDGFFFGEGIKSRIKEKLLTECNLHTIVRLPNGVFNPYTSIKTNLLFFTKGTPTKHVWFYEHQYPEGVKNYSKTRPMRIEEFTVEESWWGSEADGFAARVETEFAWKVGVEELQARNWNLDCKNPHIGERISHDPDELLRDYNQLQCEISSLRDQLKAVLSEALERQV